MDFFEHQDSSRRKTRQLVLMFVVAVAAIVAVTDLAAALFLGHGHSADGSLAGWLAANAQLLAAATVVTVLAVLGGSLFRIAALRAGDTVARGLGATEVPANPEELSLKRLRNVVEETALAAGLPVPTLFVLEREDGINAFAAGNSPADAAITVTRGALDQLSRNELQGVIAHEFSHVGNGDMRLNLTLMGWLFGILLIALAGRGILRAGARGGSRRKGGGLALFGLALVVIGYVGVFAGRLIKAAVSRERERLADSSAVQFTRDTTGLAGALKKIGGLEAGSEFHDTEAEEVSHMLFAPGLNQWLATHPPLLERIRVLEPGFNPEEFKHIRPAPPMGNAEPESDSGLGFRSGARNAAGFAATAGTPAPDDFRAGRAIRERMPAALRETAARGDAALVGALLLSSEAEVRHVQLGMVRDWLGEEGAPRVESLAESLREVGAHARLPLLQIAWPGIRRRSPEALARIGRAVRDLSQADGRTSVFEYVLGRLLRVQLHDLGHHREPARVSLNGSRAELGDLFAVVARTGQGGELEARRAYETGLSRLLPRQRPDYRPPPDWCAAMDRALDRLDRLPSVIKREVIDALAATCAHDGRLEPGEAELLRAVCASLHCPLPPASQPAGA